MSGLAFRQERWREKHLGQIQKASRRWRDLGLEEPDPPSLVRPGLLLPQSLDGLGHGLVESPETILEEEKMEPSGIEPLTSSMPLRRSTN